MYTHVPVPLKAQSMPYAPLFRTANNAVHESSNKTTSSTTSSASADVLGNKENLPGNAIPVGMPCNGAGQAPMLLAQAVLVESASQDAVVAEAVQADAQVVPAQEPVVAAQAVSADVLSAQNPLVPAQAAPGDWLQAIQCYDLNEPFHVRIGTVAGNYYPRKIPAAMADKKLLSLKVKTETGEVQVMHGVPHTLVAVGCFSGEQPLKWATEKSKEYMDRANDVAQTGEKPAKYNGIDMLVDLDSRREIKVSTGARGKNPTYVFLSTPDLIKLLSRISPELAEANADYANAGRGAMGPAAAAQVGMDAMNVALNPGSSATSALGAVGREVELRELGNAMAQGLTPAFTTIVEHFKEVHGAIGNVTGCVNTMNNTMGAVISNVAELKRKQDMADKKFEQNKKQLTAQKKLCATQKQELVAVKKKLELNDRDAERFNSEYAANWEEVDQHVARLNAEQNALKAENKDLRARMDRMEKRAAAGAPAPSLAAAVPETSMPLRASMAAAGAGNADVNMSFVPALGEVEMYEKERLAFDKKGMRYILRDKSSKDSYRMQMRKENGQIVSFQSPSVKELKQLRNKWCLQYPYSPAGRKAKNLYAILSEVAPNAAAPQANAEVLQTNAAASEPNGAGSQPRRVKAMATLASAAEQNGGGSQPRRVSELATLACAARVLVESRAKSDGKRT